MRVMIIDDSTVVRQRLMAAFLQSGEVDVVEEAASGEEALEAVDDFQPELVILDLMLPGMSGLDVLRELKKRDPSPTVVVFTNYPNPAFRRRSMELGAAHFLGKSTDVREILEFARGRPAGPDEGDSPNRTKEPS